MTLASALLLSEHSFWWLILIVALSLGLSLWLYRKKETWKETHKALVVLMFSLRFLTLFFIGLLLLKPLLNHPNTNFYKAQLLIVQDQSKSILLNQDSLAYTQAYNKRMESFKQQLKEADIPFKSYGFSDSLFSNSNLSFDQGITDISQAITEVGNFNSSEHIGGILLLSDGIYNKGEDPYYLSKNIQTPIFTVGLGDTSSYSDLKVESVNMNQLAYSQRTIPFSVDIKSVGLNGKKHWLKVYENETLLFEKAFKIDKTNYFKNIDHFLPQLEPGLHLLKFKLSVDDSEKNRINNTFMISVNVIDSKQRILILSSAPHPDIAALKTALKYSQSYEVEQNNYNDFKGNLANYDLIILHQLPQYGGGNRALDLELSQSTTALLYLVSPQSNIRQLDTWNEELKISKAIKKNEWLQASFNTDFKLFNLNQDILDFIEETPPLISPILKVQNLGEIHILSYQKIKKIATKRPLICFTENDRQKKAFIFGEGIWKWKMYDFKANGTFANFSQLIEKMVQYLCVQAPKKNLLVDAKNQYLESEQVLVKAQYYNKSMELNLNQELIFEYSNQKGESFSKPMIISKNQYQVNLSYLPEDIYNYKIMLSEDPSDILSKGSFSVLPSQLEYISTKANHALLKNISKESQAEFFTEQDWFNVIESIKNHPKFVTKSFTNYQLEEWINFRWILLIISLLISIEWLLRKYFGTI